MCLVAMAASASVTVYVKADAAPYLYVWDSSENALNRAWPGKQMTETAEVQGVTFYKATFDAESINFIINNGSGNQTGDIKDITEDVYYTYDGNNTATVYQFKQDYTVTFINGLSWETVYAYAWTGEGDAATKYTGDWPGAQITKTGTTTINGKEYDVYTCTVTATEAPGKIIFNNNGDEQTGDLTFTAGNQYVWYPIDLKHYVSNWDFTNGFTDWTVYNPKNGNAWTHGSTQVEYWIGTAVNGEFDYYQTVNNLPVGRYTISALMWNSANGVSGDAPNGNAGVYGTSGTTTVFKGVTTESNDGSLVTETTGEIPVVDGTLRLGVKNNGTMGARWFGVDWIKLTMTGTLSLDDYLAIYNEALSVAQAVDQTATMSQATLTALQTAISNDATVDKTSIDALIEAEIALLEAVDAANASIASYALLAAGGSLPDNSLDGWTCTNSQTFHINTWSSEGNSDGTGMVTPFIENWCASSGVLGNGEIYYTLPGLDPGIYKFSALIRAYSESGNAPEGASLFAGDREIAFTTGNSFEYNNMKGIYDNYAMTAQVGDDGVFKFGVKIASANFNWMAFKSCKVEYVGAAITAQSVEDLYAELPDGKMNKDVRAAAVAAYEAAKAALSLDTYEALDKAIIAAKASVETYTKLGAVIDKIDAALTAATTATASDADYQTIKTAYNEGTIADADIPEQVKAAYEAVIPVIKSQTAASADFTLAIKNPSFEYGDISGWTVTASSDTGARSTANATYAASGSDGEFLFNTWWKGSPLTQVVEDLPNGLYTLTASVASDGATIYLIANGQHNEGTETGGAYPSKDVLQEANFTFVVENGTATIGVVGGADGTAGEHKDYVEDGYWWYKADNFRLVKNRDLTPVYAVVGSKKGDDTDKAIFSGAWDAAATTDLLTLTDGVYTKTFADQRLDAQTIAYKVIKKNDVESTNAAVWYGDDENNNLELKTPVKGQYDITFTFTEENSAVTGEAVKTAEAVTITSAGWATTVTNSPLNFANSDVEAYTAKYESDKVQLTKVDNVQAETGLVLKGDEGTYYLPVIESSTTDKGELQFSSIYTYDLTDDELGQYTFYGLTVNDDEAQFVKLKKGTIQPQKAFLKVEGTNGARTLKVVFAGGETTGINAVAAENGAESIYNVNGQRVAAPAKGLYIVDGKKVVLK